MLLWAFEQGRVPFNGSSVAHRVMLKQKDESTRLQTKSGLSLEVICACDDDSLSCCHPEFADRDLHIGHIHAHHITTAHKDGVLRVYEGGDHKD